MTQPQNPLPMNVELWIWRGERLWLRGCATTVHQRKHPDPVVFRVRCKAEVQMVTSPLRLPATPPDRAAPTVWSPAPARNLSTLHATPNRPSIPRTFTLALAAASIPTICLARPYCLSMPGSVRIAAALSRYFVGEPVGALAILISALAAGLRLCVLLLAATRHGPLDFAPIAHRRNALSASALPGMAAEAVAGAASVVEQLAGLIDEHLDGVTREVRCYVLAELERHVAGHIVRASEYLRRSA